VDDKEGRRLKDGDIIGLGHPVEVGAGGGTSNPYNLVVEGLVEFMGWARNKAGVGTSIKIKKEMADEMLAEREMHAMNATGGVGVVDLTLDSDSDGANANANANANNNPNQTIKPRVTITLTDRPPAWFESRAEYAFADRKLVPQSSFRLQGQLRDTTIKLTKIPHEFLLDVNTQDSVKHLQVRNKLESGLKAWLTCGNETTTKAVINTFVEWMKTVYVGKLNDTVQDVLDGDELRDDEWEEITCAAAPNNGNSDHLALPTVQGLMPVGGVVCGVCALHMLKSRVPQVAPQAGRVGRDYTVESKIWRMMKESGAAKMLEFLNFGATHCDMLYNDVLHEATQVEAEWRRGGGAVGVPPARQQQQPPYSPNNNKNKNKNKNNYNKNNYNNNANRNNMPRSPVGAYGRAMNANANRHVVGTTLNGNNAHNSNNARGGRSASMMDSKPVFAVEPPPADSERTCSKCEAEIAEGDRAFGVLGEGRAPKWYHVACVSQRVRERALTEGVRGWSLMENGEREAVVRALVKGV